jgi:hypothetical protein
VLAAGMMTWSPETCPGVSRLVTTRWLLSSAHATVAVPFLPITTESRPNGLPPSVRTGPSAPFAAMYRAWTAFCCPTQTASASPVDDMATETVVAMSPFGVSVTNGPSLPVGDTRRASTAKCAIPLPAEYLATDRADSA